MQGTETLGDATYSPEDNKLRLYPYARLSEEDYARARKAGFRWAPRQELFVCPAWCPVAEDLLLEWCGEIGDEDTSLVDRATDRQERFEGYADKRGREADATYEHCREVGQRVPLGQPIIVGHHSERAMRAHYKRVQRLGEKACELWRTSEYWKLRASGLIAHAERLGSAPVRARRVKKLEADRRQWERRITPHGPAFEEKPYNMGCDHPFGETCKRCERQPCVWVGPKGRGAYLTTVANMEAYRPLCERWIAHLDRRLEYERTLLEAQGGLHLLKPKAKPKAPPLLNYRGPEGRIAVRNQYRPDDQPEEMAQRDMTKAEYAKIWRDYKGTRLSADGTHRVRSAMVRENGGSALVLVYLTDSKDHGRPS